MDSIRKLNPDELAFDCPTLTFIDGHRSYGQDHRWGRAVTIWEGGQSEPLPIINDRIPVPLPDGYVGWFKVQLVGDDDATLIVAGGRRVPELTNPDPIEDFGRAVDALTVKRWPSVAEIDGYEGQRCGWYPRKPRRGRRG